MLKNILSKITEKIFKAEIEAIKTLKSEINEQYILLKIKQDEVDIMGREMELLEDAVGDLKESLYDTKNHDSQLEKENHSLVAFIINNKSISSEQAYEAIKGVSDEGGYELFWAAESILGKFCYSTFAYEDNTGVFDRDSCDGYEMLGWLEGSKFDGYTYDIVPGTCYEKSNYVGIDKSSPDYIEYRKKLFDKVLANIFLKNNFDKSVA